MLECSKHKLKGASTFGDDARVGYSPGATQKQCQVQAISIRVQPQRTVKSPQNL